MAITEADLLTPRILSLRIYGVVSLSAVNVYQANCLERLFTADYRNHAASLAVVCRVCDIFCFSIILTPEHVPA